MESLRREFLPYMFLMASLGITLELLFSRRNHFSNYDRQESFLSAAIFLAGIFVNGTTKILIGFIFVFTYQHRLFELPFSQTAQFGLAFFLAEFSYYWMHRYTHEVRLGWASHTVHHSPECFNLSVAYRLGLGNFFSFLWLFHLPLLWLGFSPKIVVTCLGINLLYQFWLHTELIPKLGFLEWFLNTPSHHRVHHASNPLYLDRNYGGVVIIFDHLFGTFQVEDETVKPEYGLTEKITNKSFTQVAFLGWLDLLKDLRQYPSYSNAFNFIFRAPGWNPIKVKTSEDLRKKWLDNKENLTSQERP